MDDRLFRLINGLAGHAVWADRTFVAVAVYGPVAFVAALAWLWGRGHDPRTGVNRLAVGRALAAAALALSVGQLIILVHPRLRPFLAHHARLLIPPTTDPSFPSDHALAAFAIAGALLGTHPALGAALALFATVLGFARVFVGTHYPLDVVAGALIGTTVGALLRRGDSRLGPVVTHLSGWTDAAVGRIGMRHATAGDRRSSHKTQAGRAAE
jgi:undecaprenyl-diphosphatase